MRFEYLTPHQFQSYKPYVDTLLVTTFTPEPLDIAVPRAAARWISEELATRLKLRFLGRVAEQMWGAVLYANRLEADLLRTIGRSQEVQPRYGILLCDRVLTEEVALVQEDGVQWLLADWWHWFRARVPEHRYADTWLFLSCAQQAYRTSPEAAALGLADEVLAAMAAEGNRLLDRCLQWLAERVQDVWRQNGYPGIEPPGGSG
ncbi:MAG: hypothetical protein K6T30_02430 [Alicyclobacillus sp.]|nr:hypothetical protein [Alicyclobacillus sp.]